MFANTLVPLGQRRGDHTLLRPGCAVCRGRRCRAVTLERAAAHQTRSVGDDGVQDSGKALRRQHDRRNQSTEHHRGDGIGIHTPLGQRTRQLREAFVEFAVRDPCAVVIHGDRIGVDVDSRGEERCEVARRVPRRLGLRLENGFGVQPLRFGEDVHIADHGRGVLCDGASEDHQALGDGRNGVVIENVTRIGDPARQGAFTGVTDGLVVEGEGEVELRAGGHVGDDTDAQSGQIHPRCLVVLE